MNSFIASGRAVADPKITTGNGKTIAKFTLAIDSGKDKVDFANMVAFGKTAEIVEKYISKGMKLVVEASFHSGSYEKDGHKVYTNDFWLNSIEFMSKSEPKESIPAPMTSGIPEFEDALSDEGLPFI